MDIGATMTRLEILRRDKALDARLEMKGQPERIKRKQQPKPASFIVSWFKGKRTVVEM